jgi:hypothetical protein
MLHYDDQFLLLAYLLEDSLSTLEALSHAFVITLCWHPANLLSRSHTVPLWEWRYHKFDR